MNVNQFNDDLLVNLLEKLEQKTCFLMGEFNINLLNIDTKPGVPNFYNHMSSYFFTPYILQPTRITDKFKTLINNIFLKSLQCNACSGNITSQISDHLLQFHLVEDFKKSILQPY